MGGFSGFSEDVFDSCVPSKRINLVRETLKELGSEIEPELQKLNEKLHYKVSNARRQGSKEFNDWAWLMFTDAPIGPMGKPLKAYERTQLTINVSKKCIYVGLNLKYDDRENLLKQFKSPKNKDLLEKIITVLSNEKWIITRDDDDFSIEKPKVWETYDLRTIILDPELHWINARYDRNDPIVNSKEIANEIIRVFKVLYNIYAIATSSIMKKIIVDQESVEIKEEPVAEEEFIRRVHEYIQTKGFVFELNLIKNYYISLKTKPFVILTGISGTGKTKLAEYFADAVVENYNEQFRLIPVRPDWTDDKYLTGYYNPITEKYMSTDFIEFLITAKLDSNSPYFVCLDEMNLARVEYYFSKFLSGLESKDHVISLHDKGNFTLKKRNINEFLDLQKKYKEQKVSKEELERKGLVISHNDEFIPSKVGIPKNLYFTGTVNMDETTFQFSPKVLDRANTIEILGASKPEDFFDRKKGNHDKTGISELFKTEIKNKRNYEWPEELKDKIWKIYNILQKDDSHRYDLHFGHRIVDEIGKYMENSQGLLDQDTAFDLQILQKILPKIKGDESIKGLLEKLKIEIEPYRLSNEKLTIIEQRLNDRMYTSFF